MRPALLALTVGCGLDVTHAFVAALLMNPRCCLMCIEQVGLSPEMALSGMHRYMAFAA